MVCAVAFTALSFTSCGLTSTASHNLTETKVVLSEKNFKGIKNYGDATRIQTEELPDFDLLFEVNVLSWIIQNNNQKFHPYQLLFQF